MKSEPGVFSFSDLLARPGLTTHWDGVRNFQARNFMRDEMRPGDRVFFYHSSTEEPAVVGIAEVVREGYPDTTAFDRTHPHYDPKSTPERPLWFMVDVKAVRAMERPVTLAEMRATPALRTMGLLRKGNRLSVQPVTAAEWRVVCRLGGVEA